MQTQQRCLWRNRLNKHRRGNKSPAKRATWSSLPLSRDSKSAVFWVELFFFSLSPIWVRGVLRPKPIKSRSDANMEGSRTNRETEVSSQLTNKTNPKTDFFKLATPGLFFFIFVFSRLQLTDNYIQKILLPTLGFEPRISGVVSNRSANCATTTAQHST